MPVTHEQLIEELVAEAAAATTAERRQQQRHAFFGPVTITLGDGGATKISAFSRDISLGGIGLLHDSPLDAQTVTVSIPSVTGRQTDIRAEITWCARDGQGWCFSGARFLGLSARQKASLLLAAIVKEAERRQKQRHPFFRPVTITIGGDGESQIPAFSRDISLEGIGLLHDSPLDARMVTVRIPTGTGRPADIQAEIKWCVPGGQGWFVSGGLFKRLSLVELPEFLS